MKALFITELERTFIRKKTKILFIIFILLTILWSFTMKQWNVGFYDQNTTMELNSLNFGVFVIRDLHPLLLIVILPMLYGDSFNSEHTSGAFRNVMTRPYSKLQFIVAKLLTQAFITLIYIVIFFIITSFIGHFFMNPVETTSFFKREEVFTASQAFVYRLKFYGMEFLILMILLSVSSLICSIIPNSVLSYIATVALLLGTIYISDGFIFLFSSAKAIFDILGNSPPSNFYLIMISSIVIGIVASILWWEKKDWLH